MHFNFHFTTVETLWTLTFAAQLVLLVVLLGRDRARRFRWFTIAIVLMALRLLASRLLFGRLPNLTLSSIFIVLASVTAVVGLLVVIEMARKAFAPVRLGTWAGWALALLIVSGAALELWGPWPAWKTLTAASPLATLRLVQFGAQKLAMLVDLLTVLLGLLVVLLGRKYGAGWRTHVQRVVVGLATASLGQLAVEGMWQVIAKTAAPHSQAEYERVLGLRDKLFNANGVVYIAVLVWWIVVLWMDEPGARGDLSAQAPSPQPVYLAPPEGALETGAEAPAGGVDTLE